MNGHYASECPISGKNSKKCYNYDEFTYHSSKNCPNKTKSDEKSRHFRKGSVLMVFDRTEVIRSRGTYRENKSKCSFPKIVLKNLGISIEKSVSLFLHTPSFFFLGQFSD